VSDPFVPPLLTLIQSPLHHPPPNTHTHTHTSYPLAAAKPGSSPLAGLLASACNLRVRPSGAARKSAVTLEELLTFCVPLQSSEQQRPTSLALWSLPKCRHCQLVRYPPAVTLLQNQVTLYHKIKSPLYHHRFGHLRVTLVPLRDTFGRLGVALVSPWCRLRVTFGRLRVALVPPSCHLWPPWCRLGVTLVPPWCHLATWPPRNLATWPHRHLVTLPPCHLATSQPHPTAAPHCHTSLPHLTAAPHCRTPLR
jgi:hypothetical protein